MIFKKYILPFILRNPRMYHLPLSVLAVVFITPTTTTFANPPNIKNVMTQMIPIAQTIVNLKNEEDGLKSEIVNKKKKLFLWHDQQDGRLNIKFKELNTEIVKHDANGKRLTTEIERYNMACEGEQPEPQLTKCNSEIAVLTPLRKKFMANAKKLTKRQDGLNDEWDKYSDLIDADQKTIEKKSKRLRRIAKLHNEYSNQLSDYNIQLVTLCDAVSAGDKSIEFSHYCQSINWDGANRNIPPLTIINWGTKFFK